MLDFPRTASGRYELPLLVACALCAIIEDVTAIEARSILLDLPESARYGYKLPFLVAVALRTGVYSVVAVEAGCPLLDLICRTRCKVCAREGTGRSYGRGCSDRANKHGDFEEPSLQCLLPFSRYVLTAKASSHDSASPPSPIFLPPFRWPSYGDSAKAASLGVPGQVQRDARVVPGAARGGGRAPA